MPRIQLRRGTAAQWAAENPVLASGEAGVETDTGYMKIGNGVQPWSQRPYQAGPPGPSAYQVALSQGFTGTAEQWLESLRSTVPGPPGTGLEIDGTVPTYAALPVEGLVPDAKYMTIDTGRLYVWTGTAWPAEQDGIQLQGPPGTTSWAGIEDRPETFPPADHRHPWGEIDGKPPVIAAGANAAAARSAIGAMASSLAPELVTALPADPIMGKLYCLPEV